MKLDKKKFLAAIFSAQAFIGLNASPALAINKDVYIEDGNLTIKEFGSYSVTIDEEELNSGKDITITIGNKEIIIDSETIENLKEEAYEQEKELNRYKLTIYTVLGIVTIIVLKTTEKIKRKWKIIN